tara:strand:+ start:3493 stop:3657 length:165 start_codon:yes stop_codon:yes gene_type:complete
VSYIAKLEKELKEAKEEIKRYESVIADIKNTAIYDEDTWSGYGEIDECLEKLWG